MRVIARPPGTAVVASILLVDRSDAAPSAPPSQEPAPTKAPLGAALPGASGGGSPLGGPPDMVTVIARVVPVAVATTGGVTS